MQKRKPLRTIHSPAMMRKAMVEYVHIRNFLDRKMRMKRTRTESLARMRERL
jgi:hypothetical protein